jgi:squalene synthase HpnC
LNTAPNSVPFAGLPPEYAIPEHAPSLADARAYCERLARSHYENFSVATWFLPARLRPHFYSVYAYCRISDDLGDEVGDPLESLRLLDEWEGELNACYNVLRWGTASAGPQAAGLGKGTTVVVSQNALPGEGVLAPGDIGPRHPVFVALLDTIRACDIPRQPFADLLKAFRQDQTVGRYPTFDEVLDYCCYSANPVGHLVLYVCGYRDEERQQLSDFTCTALQLANFWQDVWPDYGKGRIYIPLDDLQRYGVTEQDIAARRPTSQFRELMKFQVERARQWFVHGLPLARKVDKELAIDIELFSRGGQQILNAIKRQNYDVLTSRPAISKAGRLALVTRAALGKLL